MRLTKRHMAWVGYPLLYLCFLGIFAYVSFPYERLKARIIAGYNAEQASKAEPGRMAIGELTWSWRFPGIVLTDIELIGPMPPETSDTSRSGTGASDSDPVVDEKAKPKRSVIHIDEAYATVGLWSALSGTTDVEFSAEGFGGSLSGSFLKSEEVMELSVGFEGVDPGQLPGVVETLQLPLSGSLTGSVSLQVPEAKYSKANGEIDLVMDELTVADGKTKVRGMFALPRVNVGSLAVLAKIEEGKASIEKFEAAGQDLEVKAEGKLRLRDDLAQSVIEQMDLAFKFSDSYRDKDETTRSLLGKPGDKIGGAIDLDPQVKRAKKPDGFYRWRVSGSVSRPRFIPARTTTAPKRPSTKRPARRPKAP